MLDIKKPYKVMYNRLNYCGHGYSSSGGYSLASSISINELISPESSYDKSRGIEDFHVAKFYKNQMPEKSEVELPVSGNIFAGASFSRYEANLVLVYDQETILYRRRFEDRRVEDDRQSVLEWMQENKIDFAVRSRGGFFYQFDIEKDIIIDRTGDIFDKGTWVQREPELIYAKNVL